MYVCMCCYAHCQSLLKVYYLVSYPDPEQGCLGSGYETRVALGHKVRFGVTQQVNR